MGAQNLVFCVVNGCKIVVKVWLETAANQPRKMRHILKIYFWSDLLKNSEKKCERR